MNTYISNLCEAYIRDDSGATAIEYGLIAALIAVAMIGGAKALGGAINDLFGDVDGELQNNMTA